MGRLSHGTNCYCCNWEFFHLLKVEASIERDFLFHIDQKTYIQVLGMSLNASTKYNIITVYLSNNTFLTFTFGLH